MKKLSLIILALIMGLALSTSLMAYSGGDGTSATPYQIATKTDLKYLSETTGDWTMHFIQTADIAFAAVDFESGGDFYDGGAGFSPIGNNSIRFSGSYNGDGHTIDGLYINRASADYIGLFGYTESSTIQNLGVTNVNITGKDYVGGLVGYNYNADISNSYSTGSVSGTRYVGGLVGYNNYNSTTSNSYSTGSVTGATNVGGLVGRNTSSPVSNSFWDTQTSQQETSGGGTGKTTIQMKTQSTFTDAGWDFTVSGDDHDWVISSVNDGYPHLKWAEAVDASLPVELSSFTARQERSTGVLEWVTESEIDNLGFILERRRPETGDWTEIASYLTNPELQGQGSVTHRTQYEYIDQTVEPNTTYEYRLADVSYDGIVEFHLMTTLAMSAENLQPLQFGLKPAYPNPFNPNVTLRYGLTQEARTALQVYNLRGQLVETLVSAYQPAGTYDLNWQPVNLSTGVYLVRLQSGNESNLQKIVFVK